MKVSKADFTEVKQISFKKALLATHTGATSVDITDIVEVMARREAEVVEHTRRQTAAAVEIKYVIYFNDMSTATEAVNKFAHVDLEQELKKQELPGVTMISSPVAEEVDGKASLLTSQAGRERLQGVSWGLLLLMGGIGMVAVEGTR